MKKVLLTLIAVVLCLVLTGCSNNTEEIKSELRGVWSYDIVDNTNKKHLTGTYEFGMDGSVHYMYKSSTDSSLNEYKWGSYEIKNGKIVIEYLVGDGTTIEYTYKNGNLRLFDKGSSGNLDRELKRK